MLIVVAGIFLTGCRSDDPLRHFVVADSPRMFNVVTPLSGRSVSSVIDGVRYDIAFDDVSRVATITISNLRGDESQAGVNAVFEDVVFTYEPGSHQKQRIIEQKQLNSLINPGAAVTLSDVTFVYTESNELNPARTSGFYAEYTVDNSYKVLAYPYNIYADGTTTIRQVDSETGDVIDYDPVYTVRLYPDQMKADISIRGLTLGGEEHDFTIEGLALRLMSDGYALSKTYTTRIADSIAPSVVLTVFNATARLRDELNVDFEVSVGEIKYMVEAFLTPDMCKKSES